MSLANTILGGVADVAAKSPAEPRPLALQQEEAGAPDFTSLLNSALRPEARREARERQDAGIDRARRAERGRAGVRASERAAERAADRARAAASTHEPERAERDEAPRAAEGASSSGRADELRYGMLSERRAERSERAGSAEPTTATAESAAATGAGAPPQLQDGTDAGAGEDRSSALRTTATAEQAEAASGEAAKALAAEASAAEASAAATLAAASADPTRVVRDPNTLTPEFRQRLERVVDRMRDEFGHQVQIVEAARTPERQDFLYEQGRTRPGAVVTWTHNSRHLDGRAADLMIDGSYGDQAAFQRLHAIAAEEGLRTLGARDPGHVELAGAPVGGPRGAAMLAALQAVASVDEVRVSAPAGEAAPVAQVAAVAQVAPVAQVAQVGGVASVAAVASPMAAQQVAASQGAGSVRDGKGDERAERRAARTAETAERRAGERHEERGDALAGLRHAAERAPQLTGGVEAPAPVMATDAASRISQVLELQDAAAVPRPMSHMMLRVDNAVGGEDRIRVDLRGLGVGTNIDVTDAATADRLGSRVGELQRALERHGLESETVRIGVRGAEAPDAARSAAAAAQMMDRDGMRPAEAGGSSSQQSNHNSQHSQDSQRQGADDDRRRTTRDQDEPGQHAGESRHRSRREPQGDRKR